MRSAGRSNKLMQLEVTLTPTPMFTWVTRIHVPLLRQKYSQGIFLQGQMFLLTFHVNILKAQHVHSLAYGVM